MPDPDLRSVFVIHGRNEAARKGLFEFLRAVGLKPIEWSQAIAMTGQGSPYIGDVLDAAFGAAQAVVVLQTPDDVAYLHPSLTHAGDPETNAQFQPRPNVLFEAGMAMGRAPERTVLVELGQVKSFSDIHGRHVVRLDNSVAKRSDLVDRLETAGCAVDRSGRDWHDAGDLTPPTPPGGGLPMGRRVPASATTGIPKFRASYQRNPGSSPRVEIANLGPGDAFNVDVAAPEDEQLMTKAAGLPLQKLPEGKTVRIIRAVSLGQGSTNFDITISGTTADGVAFTQEEFVSTT